MDKVNYVLVNAEGEPLEINEVPVYSPDELRRRLRATKPILYNAPVIPLDPDRVGVDNEEFVIAGDFFAVQEITGGVIIQVIFNELTNAPIDLVDHLAISTPFYRFFLIHATSPGETLTVIIGRESLFKLEWMP